MKLSVVIPAYNEESQLPGCLDSLLAQTRAIDEIIVVDNNSTDRTSSVVADYAARHAAVRHEFEPVQGVHAARSRGLDSATSELIAKVDADTRVGPDWAALGVEFLAGPRGREFSALTGPLLLADAPFEEFQKRMAARSYGKLAEGGSIGSVHGPRTSSAAMPGVRSVTACTPINTCGRTSTSVCQWPPAECGWHLIHDYWPRHPVGACERRRGATATTFSRSADGTRTRAHPTHRDDDARRRRQVRDVHLLLADPPTLGPDHPHVATTSIPHPAPGVSGVPAPRSARRPSDHDRLHCRLDIPTPSLPSIT